MKPTAGTHPDDPSITPAAFARWAAEVADSDPSLAALLKAQEAYTTRFGAPYPLHPIGVSDEHMAEVLLAAVKRGRPVAKNFDWYKWLLPGAVA